MAITASTHSVGLLYPHLFTKVFLGPDLGDVEHTVPRLFCITLNGLPELQRPSKFIMNDKHIWFYSFPMRKGVLDDDYFFYEDGRILHSYDKTQTKININEFVSAETIPVDKRMIMLEACPEELKPRISKILEIDVLPDTTNIH
ncbi:MAG: hypothetical protein HUK14_10945 [Muribaculaceae bacterium]|nr:hypothetical protein [Muribaculaceae bacterium]